MTRTEHDWIKTRTGQVRTGRGRISEDEEFEPRILIVGV